MIFIALYWPKTVSLYKRLRTIVLSRGALPVVVPEVSVPAAVWLGTLVLPVTPLLAVRVDAAPVVMAVPLVLTMEGVTGEAKLDNAAWAGFEMY